MIKPNFIRCKNGISINSDINVHLQKEPKSNNQILQIFISILTTFSVLCMFQSYFVKNNCEYPFSNKIELFLTIILTTLSVYCIHHRDKFFKAVGITYIVLYIIYLLLDINNIDLGLTYTTNQYMDIADPYYITIEVIKINFDPKKDLVSFINTLSFIFSFLISLSCVFFQSFILLFLSTFPVFLLGIVNGWEPALWTVAILITVLMSSLSISLINYKASHRTFYNFAVSNRKQAFYLVSSNIKSKYLAYHTMYTIAISAAVFCLSITFSYTNSRPKGIDNIGNTITENFYKFTDTVIDKLVESSEDEASASNIHFTGISNGQNLGAKRKVDYTNTEVMKIRYSLRNKPIYLKGYVAEVYNNKDSDYYKWDPAEMDEHLKEQFRSNNIYSLDYTFFQNYINSEILNTTRTTIEIDYTNTSDTLFYAPYGANYSDSGLLSNLEQKNDGMIKFNSSPKLSYTLNVSDYKSLSSWNGVINRANKASSIDPYIDNLQFYSEAIFNSKELYEVPENLKPLIQNIITEAKINTKKDSISAITKKIDEYFYNNGFVYSLEPGYTPEGQDFIETFLENKKGYCRYYASLGVMIMRELNIPARYVEGYVVIPNKNEKGWITVRDNSAHAWCEIFIDGAGWYPIDITPSYTEPKETLTKEVQNKNNNKITNLKDNVKSEEKPVFKEPVFEEERKLNENKMNPIYFIIIIPIYMISRRKYKLNKIRENTNSGKDHEIVISCYTVLLKYLVLLGIKNNENLTDTQLSEFIKEKLDPVSSELKDIYIDLSESAIFYYMSNETPKKQDIKKTQKKLRTAKRIIYSKLNFYQKFKARWVYGFY